MGIGGSVNIGTNASITGTTAHTGAVTISSSTASSTSSTGALVVTGGVGIGGSVNIGTNASIIGTTAHTGAVTISSSTASADSSTGALVVTGGVGIGGSVNIATNIGVTGTTSLTGAVTISNSTASTTSSTGALTVTGGVGIGGSVNIGANATVTGTTSFTGATTHAGTVNITNTTTSGNSTSGALTVAGGVGIAGGLNVAGSIGISGSTISTGTITAPSLSVSGSDPFSTTGLVSVSTVSGSTNSNIQYTKGLGYIQSNNAIVAAGLGTTTSNFAYYTTNDGVTWTSIPLTGTASTVYSGYGTWTLSQLLTSPSTGAIYLLAYGVVSGKSISVIFTGTTSGLSSYLTVSLNNLNTLTTATSFAVQPGGNYIIVIGIYGSTGTSCVWSSTNGGSSFTLGGNSYPISVFWCGGSINKFILTYGNGPYYLAYSSTGATFTGCTVPSSTIPALSVYYNSAIGIAIATNSQSSLWYSYDGITWTNISYTPPNGGLGAIVNSTVGGLFAVYSPTGNASPQVSYSTNGTTWTTISCTTLPYVSSPNVGQTVFNSSNNYAYTAGASSAMVKIGPILTGYSYSVSATTPGYLSNTANSGYKWLNGSTSVGAGTQIMQLDNNGLNISNTTNSTSTTTGSIVTTGGIGIAQGLTVGTNASVGGTLTTTGAVSINNTTNSTSTTTGAIVTTGGVGIAQALYVGSGINGTIQTTAQPNITSLGTLSSLTVTGAITAGTVNGVTSTQLGYLNVTPGAASASKALVLNSSSNITGINCICLGSSTDTSRYLSILNGSQTTGSTMYNLSYGQSASSNNEAEFAFSYVGSGSTSNALSIGFYGNTNIFRVNADQSVDIPQHNGSSTGLRLGGTLITATAAQLNYTTATPGTASASKALILDGSFNITGISTLTATTLAGTLSTAAQPNITSVGTLSSLTLSGAINGVTTLTATTLSGTLSTAAQPNITSIGTLASLAVTGAITAGTVNGITSTQLGYLNVTPGTSTAGAAVVLDSSSNFATTGRFFITSNYGYSHKAASTGAEIITYTDGASGSVIGTFGSNDFAVGTNIGTNSTYGLTVKAGSSGSVGNVGINNSSPSYQLDVSGSFNATSYYIGKVSANIAALTGITAGTALASKALILDSSKNITGLNQLTSTTLVATNLTLGGTAVTSSQFNLISGVTPGTPAASKALSLDASSNINGYVRFKSGIQVGTSTDTSRMISSLDSTMAANSSRYITLGQDASANNEAEISFNYVSSGSGTNYLGLGLFGSTTMYIQGQNRVGINQSSPQFALDVSGDINCTGNTTVGGNATLNGSSTTINGSVAVGGNATLNGSSNTINGSVTVTGASTFQQQATLQSGLYVTGNQSSKYSGAAYAYRGSSGSDGNASASTVSGTQFTLYVNGYTFCASTTYSLSDRRVKTDIENLDIDMCKRFITDINARSYKFINSEDNGALHYGYIAQDIVKNGFTSLVTISEDDSLEEELDEDGYVISPKGLRFSVSYTEIIPILSTNVKNLYEEIDSLKQKNDDLEARLAKLEALLLNNQ